LLILRTYSVLMAYVLDRARSDALPPPRPG
jgi:hypothetical protein